VLIGKLCRYHPCTELRLKNQIQLYKKNFAIKINPNFISKFSTKQSNPVNNTYMKSTLILNNITLQEIDNRTSGKTKSTFYVPANLCEFLKYKIRSHGSLIKYFETILTKFRVINYSGMLPNSSRVKTVYQEAGLELVRFDFEPRNEDWIELGSLAMGLGVSRTWLFVFLLELDSTGFGEICSETLSAHGTPGLAFTDLGQGSFSRNGTGSYIRAISVRPPYLEWDTYPKDYSISHNVIRLLHSQ
jgi:hypothetical protein